MILKSHMLLCVARGAWVSPCSAWVLALVQLMTPQALSVALRKGAVPPANRVSAVFVSVPVGVPALTCPPPSAYGHEPRSWPSPSSGGWAPEGLVPLTALLCWGPRPGHLVVRV